MLNLIFGFFNAKISILIFRFNGKTLSENLRGYIMSKYFPTIVLPIVYILYICSYVA